ncbi:MAG: Rieske 2Fe-2S domain-containing protein [Actinomycetota bacterium]
MTTNTCVLVAIGRVEDVPMYEGRAVSVEGRRLAVFRTDTGFHAISAECPHKKGPLADGLVGGDTVTCPLHARRFDLVTGKAVSGGDGCDSVEVFTVVERDGWLYIELGD